MRDIKVGKRRMLHIRGIERRSCDKAVVRKQERGRLSN
jgi:hypothetical protein